VIAARLRSLFAQMPWAHGESGRPSLSIGIAETALDRPDALDRAIREADAALYAAKRRGRDAVACSRVA
jgi:GGDEF domain-containing protein